MVSRRPDARDRLVGGLSAHHSTEPVRLTLRRARAHRARLRASPPRRQQQRRASCRTRRGATRFRSLRRFDPQECRRRRDPRSTGRSSTRPCGRSRSGTRTCPRWAPGRTGPSGKQRLQRSIESTPRGCTTGFLHPRRPAGGASPRAAWHPGSRGGEGAFVYMFTCLLWLLWQMGHRARLGLLRVSSGDLCCAHGVIHVRPGRLRDQVAPDPRVHTQDPGVRLLLCEGPLHHSSMAVLHAHPAAAHIRTSRARCSVGCSLQRTSRSRGFQKVGPSRTRRASSVGR